MVRRPKGLHVFKRSCVPHEQCFIERGKSALENVVESVGQLRNRIVEVRWLTACWASLPQSGSDIREAGRQHLGIGAWCLSRIGVEVADHKLRLDICGKTRKDLARLRRLCRRVGFIEMRRYKFD